MRHRMSCGRVVSVAPLLQPLLQVSVAQASQAWDFAYALGTRAMAGPKSRYIQIWNTFLVYRSSGCDEFAISVACRFRRYRGQVICQITRCLWTDVRGGGPHVHF